MAKILRQIVAALRPPREPETPVPPEPPPAVVNPDLDVERPDEAFEVLRRVADAVEGDQRFVSLKKGRVPPHQRHLTEKLDLGLGASLAEETPPVTKGTPAKPSAKGTSARHPKRPGPT